MDRVKGKRLLVISSDSSDIAFVKAAKEMGVYVVCCDRYCDWEISPAKKIADDAWNIDYTDTEQVVQKCREEHIDGVIAGYGEDRVAAASRISQKLGTSFYATEEMINITRNKRKFKELCKKYNIPVPLDFCSSLPVTHAQREKIKYPVIVKPSDNGGRKGISVCTDETQLDAAVYLAARQSKYNEIIIEEYLRGVELCAVYTICDGKASLSCLNDKYISQEQGGTSRLCDAVITPSGYYELYQETIDAGVKALLKDIGAKNGVANFQLIFSNGCIKAFEMGYRINGNDDFKVIRKYNHIDFMKMLISHSLTGTMGDDINKDNPIFPQYNCTLCMHVHEGTIGKLEYNSLQGKPGIDDICILKSPGSVIKESGTNAHKALMVKMSAKTLSEITDLIHFTQNNIRIEDTAGRNMLFKQFDANRLLCFKGK